MNTILNLVYPEKSHIDYEIARFPDGHKHIKLKGDFNKHQKIDIICRICNADDLFILLQIKDILSVNDVRTGRIIIYYLFTMRCDRRFTIGEAHDLNIILTTLKDLFGDETITLIDPHTNIHPRKLDLHSTEYMITNFNYKDYRICFPDEGAKNRLLDRFVDYGDPLSDFNSYVHSKLPIICTKERFGKDNLTVTVNDVEKWEKKKLKNVLVVDDLCDGGLTFVKLAEELRRLSPKKLSIFITHAIQINGITELSKVYDEVFITDSYRNWGDVTLRDNVKVIKLNY